MTAEELARELRRMYDNAPKGEQNTAVLLFGIKYAAYLPHGTSRLADVIRCSKLPANWRSEANKGRNLAKYVELKDNTAARFWPNPNANG